METSRDRRGRCLVRPMKILRPQSTLLPTRVWDHSIPVKYTSILMSINLEEKKKKKKPDPASQRMPNPGDGGGGGRQISHADGSAQSANI